MMRKFVTAAGSLMLGVGLALALLEITLRFLPVSMGLYPTQSYDQWPLQSYEPARPYTYSKSWALRNAHRGTTNNYGHIAPFDFRKATAPVIVLGDSFVEGLMNEYADTLQGRLGTRLGAPTNVYGLGVSGLSIGDYLALSRFARDEFQPAAAVVVISDGDITESVAAGIGHHSFSVKNGVVSLDYRPRLGESTFTKIRIRIGEISLYRYLQANLGLSLERLWRWGNAGPVAPERPATELFPVVDYFLRNLPAALSLPSRCIAFLVDSDRYAIYKAQLATRRKDEPLLQDYFLREAKALGFHAVDLDPVFRRAYAHDKLKFDYWPIDRHWNALGHEIAANEAFHLLYDEGSADCRPGRKAAPP
jgi:hypothetical protein